MAELNVSPQRLQTWQKRWDENNIRFHKMEVNSDLVKFHDRITIGRKALTFVVPLCGKSLDVFWLYQQGHTVIGIEGIGKAIIDFFSEHKINHEIKKIGTGLVFESEDGRLRIYYGDFFEFTSDIIGEVDCVWDRGSLVALYEKDRCKYAQIMKSFLKPTFHYLLQTLEYDAIVAEHVTPKSVSCDQVVQLFGDTCNVEFLETIEMKKEDLPTINAPVILQHNMLLTRKTG